MFVWPCVVLLLTVVTSPSSAPQHRQERLTRRHQMAWLGGLVSAQRIRRPVCYYWGMQNYLYLRPDVSVVRSRGPNISQINCLPRGHPNCDQLYVVTCARVLVASTTGNSSSTGATWSCEAKFNFVNDTVCKEPDLRGYRVTVEGCEGPDDPNYYDLSAAVDVDVSGCFGGDVDDLTTTLVIVAAVVFVLAIAIGVGGYAFAAFQRSRRLLAAAAVPGQALVQPTSSRAMVRRAFEVEGFREHLHHQHESSGSHSGRSRSAYEVSDDGAAAGNGIVLEYDGTVTVLTAVMPFTELEAAVDEPNAAGSNGGPLGGSTLGAPPGSAGGSRSISSRGSNVSAAASPYVVDEFPSPLHRHQPPPALQLAPS